MAQVITGLTTARMRHSIACLKGEPEITDRLPQQTQIHCFNARPNESHLPFCLVRLVRRLRPHDIHARNRGAWPNENLARLFTFPVVPLVLSFHSLVRPTICPVEGDSLWFL
jgi:hypothetical protein